ncbi:PLP-dependent aminotransferase family protein [Flexivirga meconopsidis]|uniref:MocR-like pyridoxine biosynthesis transcription factor PdxR n=1 Tax=Flexivirga meconopsidis TaxID=2977121 RepID=UPI0022407544|nr:PLP-dependent aminotransferase family protein [Flexivirga meconopsidis]
MSWHMTLEVDRSAVDSLTHQVQQAIRSRIENDLLPAGSRLPSTRQLAADLGISRSVAVEAYEQLTAEGFLLCRRGSGTLVADQGAEKPAGAIRALTPARIRWDLRCKRGPVPDFPHAEWLGCYRTALAAAGESELGYVDPDGSPRLREVLARYLARVRVAAATVESVTITAGFAQGISLISQVLQDRGLRQVGMEEPCSAAVRTFLQRGGLEPVPVPLTRAGLDMRRLRESGVRAVVVSPAHQFPTGQTMSGEGRAALVEWAREVDGWIVEDDYDGDLWLDAASRTVALHALDPERVIYGGTTSMTMAPGLRLGWLVVPEALREEMAAVRRVRDLGVDTLQQCALAEFVTSGLFDRHLRRVRLRYRSRRELFVSALHRHFPHAQLTGNAAGVHAQLLLPRWMDEADFVAAAARRGVQVDGGAHFWAHTASPPASLILSYAGVSASGLGDAVTELGLAAQAMDRSRKWQVSPPTARVGRSA